MMDIRQVTPDFAVSPQIAIEDLPVIAQFGFKTIINNRPDGEQSGQPLNAELKENAEKLGLTYIFLPIDSGSFNPEAVEKTAEAIEQSTTPLLAFCRSGTRSISLWALSQSPHHAQGDLYQLCQNAGYDLPFLAHI